MISTSEFTRGMLIEHEGEVYEIIFYQQHRSSQGKGVVRTKIRNIRTGQVFERTFKSGDKFEEPDVEKKQVSYLYQSGDSYVFMDQATYEQFNFSRENIGEQTHFLREGLEIYIILRNGEILGVDFPLKIDLKVKYTEPGVKGDTVTNVFKAATLESGFEIKVPLFINTGDVIKVDTRTGEYIERVA